MNLQAIAVPEAGSPPAGTEGRGASGAPNADAPENPRAAKRKEREEEAPPPLTHSQIQHALKERGEESLAQTLSDDGQRLKLILKLKAYGNCFPEAAVVLKDKSLDGMSMRELELLLNQVKFTVGARTSGIVTAEFASGGLELLELGLASNTSLMVDGPAVSLSSINNSADYQSLVKELTLEYADWIYTKPENRFMAYLAKAIYSVHKINQKAVEDGSQPSAKRMRGVPTAPEEREQLAAAVYEIPARQMSEVVLPALPPPPHVEAEVASSQGGTGAASANKDAQGFELPTNPPPKPAPKPVRAGQPVPGAPAARARK